MDKPMTDSVLTTVARAIDPAVWADGVLDGAVKIERQRIADRRALGLGRARAVLLALAEADLPEDFRAICRALAQP